MKIMSSAQGLRDASRTPWAHTVFTAVTEAGGAPTTALVNFRRSVMKWETPSAIDFRFGFEITMYIATR
jgi:coenzyme PQQ precursor peptide PqqA